MRNRCRCPTHPQYADYGGRVITVCERWNAFENFLADMGPRPSPKHSIDRIDNNGNYEPGNCRWATRIEQMGNTRVTRFLTINGERFTLTEAAARFGVSRKLISSRLERGQSDHNAVFKVKHSHTPRVRR